MTTMRIGIIGAGIMGVGIASICSFYGHEVSVFVRASEKASKVESSISRNVKKLCGRNDMPLPTNAVDVVSDYSAFSNCDIVIECVTENIEDKQIVYERLAKVLPEKTIIASNTSSISINKLAALSDRPEKFLGLHFMNPAQVIPLTEVIKGAETSQRTIDTASKYLNTLDRVVVNASDTPGFIVNRLLITMINEAANLVEENIGSVEDIDTCMKIGANHPLGPLALADLIGIDTCLAIMETIHLDTQDDKYKPSSLLVDYTQQGRLGRKSRHGFYNY